ncbi:FAD-dependent oxidoreductase [Pectobacterium punjabense]|uniref:FAD-dependent oxidoreductase n=1 Tax=Pectobacterium punjabense TaxID=2108399 RepID=A0ABX6L293_9GAMM|nr:FAD-dependent oxidoreductase [Pectobacterium punjabense]MBS4432030.1 FAD-dependent oxidoreductase [Pectobacterium punjabense]PTA63844.1 FAD-dependent oxidoreductase [Pectobacterium punjabense]QJA20426.1 FAD-dependent oxidoreductase [Pectobacterium punjabense]
MKIAIIGSGISGLTCALRLSERFQVSIFEANNYLGGHTATVDVVQDGIPYAIDTGFIVYNERTYPNFIALLDELGLIGQPTEMSFSVSNPVSGLEYNGHTLNTLFAQRANLFRPAFYRFVAEIVRFNRVCKRYLASGEHQRCGLTLSHLLQQEKFSPFFAQHYLLPMGAAIWSSSLEDMRHFPLSLFLTFFNHHGLLDLVNRPQWMVVPGGSREYVRRIAERIRDRATIHLHTPVSQVIRDDSGITLHTAEQAYRFDQVIFACHSDQALALLETSTSDERRILGGIRYQPNHVILHTDTQLLPHNHRAWASWNYRLPVDQALSHSRASVTYNMNILQGFRSSTTFCVSLNPQQDIDPDKTLHHAVYHHPVFTQQTTEYQQQRERINGHHRSWFCGAYWYNGFHEDGVKSALDVISQFDQGMPYE